MKRKNFTKFILSIGLLVPMAIIKPAFSQAGTDTLAPQVTTLRDRISGVEDRITNAEADLSKLTKIKLSGYVQAQWQHFEQASVYPSNYLQIRRARFKLQYEPATGVALVIQPDFQPSNFVIKEAYARLNEPWLKMFSLWAGKFNRPNYEVEYSSSDLENLERSRVITSIYPGEYAIGAKLEFAPPKIPLKFQLAVFNGNDNMTIADASGANINPDNKDFDNSKDIMARLTYAFKLGSFGGLTIGAHTYIGFMKATDTTLVKSDYTFDKKVKVGSNLSRNWVGLEAQLYMDVLGGLTLKGEYIMGTNAYPGFNSNSKVSSQTFAFNKTNDTLTMTTLTTINSVDHPNIIRNFSGYYVYLIKNIGKRHQISVRYDYYDPNTKISGSAIGTSSPANGQSSTTTTTTTVAIGSFPVTINKTITTTNTNNLFYSGAADIAYGTLGFCYNYYITDNIRLGIAYDIPMNEKVGTHLDKKGNTVGNVTSGYSVNGVGGTNDYSNLIKANILTIRLQAKF